MLNDLLDVFISVLLEFFQKLVLSPIGDFIQGAIFGFKDPLA